MTAPITGFTSSLPDDVILDSAVLYIGGTVFGATQGGLNLELGKEIRNVEFDGKKSKVYLLDRTMMVNPVITGTVIELGPTDVANIEPGASTVTSGVYVGKRGGVQYVSGDYLSDVSCVWKRGAATGNQYVAVNFPKALVVNWSLGSQDGGEGQLAITLEARLDMTVSGASVGNMPYRTEFLTALPT